MIPPMIGRLTLTMLTALAAALVALVVRANPASTNAAKPSAGTEKVDPKSKEALARMSDYLKTLQSFTLRAETSKDEIVHDDFKLQRDTAVTLRVRRPDRLRADVEGTDGPKSFIYDGKTLVLYTQNQNYYATMPAPPTIRETLDAAMAQHGVELPLVDFLYAAGGEDLGAQINASSDIGPSKVAGADCEQYAYRGPKVDWQLWIEQGDRPLPRKLVITTRDAPTTPQYEAVLTWDVSPRFDDTTFTFSPPAGATQIEFGPQKASGGDLSKTPQQGQ